MPNEECIKTSTGTPVPIAKAIEPQVPEPKPWKLNDGTTPAGQFADGKAISKPEDECTHLTRRVERSANALRFIGGWTLNTSD